MKRLLKVLSVMFAVLGLFVLASCDSTDGFKGKMTVTPKKDSLEVAVEFDTDSRFENNKAWALVKVYDIDSDDNETYKSYKDVTLKNHVTGSCTFTSLSTKTKYVLKLYVTYNSKEILIETLTTSTREDGNTESEAIKLTSAADVLAIGDNPDAYYVLENDIDMEGKTVALCNTSSTAFTGTLDGNGHMIHNFKLDSNNYSGFFGYVSKATIKNVVFDCDLGTTSDTKNAVFTMTSTTKYFGVVAGFIKDSKVDNVQVKNAYIKSSSYTTSDSVYGIGFGEISSTSVANVKIYGGDVNFTEVKPSSSYTSYVGMFAGYIGGTSEIKDSYAEANFKTSVNGAGQISIGGFAGTCDSSKLVSNCYYKGKLDISKGSSTSKDLSIGGFAGQSVKGQCNLNGCLVIADILVNGGSSTSGETTTYTVLATKAAVGGIVGDLSSSPLGVKNCVYAPLTAKSTSEAKGGLDFTGKISTVEEGKSYTSFVSLTIAKNSVKTAEGNVATADALTYAGIEDGAIASVVKASTISTDVSFLSADLQALLA